MSLSLIDIIYTSIKLLLYLGFLTQLSQIYFFVESINVIKCRLVIVCRLKKTMQNYVQYRYHRYSWNVSYNFIEFFLHQIRYHINVRDDAYRFTRFSYKQNRQFSQYRCRCVYTCNEILDLDIHANQIMSWSNNSWSDD